MCLRLPRALHTRMCIYRDEASTAVGIVCSRWGNSCPDNSSVRLSSWCRCSQELLDTETGLVLVPANPVSAVCQQCWPVAGPKQQQYIKYQSMHVGLAFLSLRMEEFKMWVILPKLWPWGPPQVRASTLENSGIPSLYCSAFPQALFLVHSYDGLPTGCHH